MPSYAPTSPPGQDAQGDQAPTQEPAPAQEQESQSAPATDAPAASKPQLDIAAALAKVKSIAANINAKRSSSTDGEPDMKRAPSEQAAVPAPTQAYPSAIPASGPITVDYYIPNQHVGRIIGKSGETINRIQRESNCQVQIAHDMGQPQRPCQLTGQPGPIEHAKTLIENILKELESGAGQSGDQGPPPEHTEDYMVKAEQVGLVIGKGGETIKMLQERSGAHLQMIQEPQYIHEKPLRISGSREAVARALDEVKRLIQEKEGFSEPLPGMSKTSGDIVTNTEHYRSHKIEVKVPRVAVGRVIGRGGETIKEIQMDTGSKIQFEPETNGDFRTATIAGTREVIERAEKIIMQIIQDAQSSQQGPSSSGGGQEMYGAPSGPVEQLPVPADRAGLVIGRGGENIKMVQQRTGAKIEQERGSARGADKLFYISGTPQQIEAAKAMIMEKINSARPRNGSGGPGGPGGFGGPQQQPYQQRQQFPPAYGHGGPGGPNPYGQQPYGGGYQDPSYQYYNQQQYYGGYQQQGQQQQQYGQQQQQQYGQQQQQFGQQAWKEQHSYGQMSQAQQMYAARFGEQHSTQHNGASNVRHTVSRGDPRQQGLGASMSGGVLQHQSAAQQQYPHQHQQQDSATGGIYQPHQTFKQVNQGGMMFTDEKQLQREQRAKQQEIIRQQIEERAQIRQQEEERIRQEEEEDMRRVQREQAELQAKHEAELHHKKLQEEEEERKQAVLKAAVEESRREAERLKQEAREKRMREVEQQQMEAQLQQQREQEEQRIQAALEAEQLELEQRTEQQDTVGESSIGDASAATSPVKAAHPRPPAKPRGTGRHARRQHMGTAEGTAETGTEPGDARDDVSRRPEDGPIPEMAESRMTASARRRRWNQQQQVGDFHLPTVNASADFESPVPRRATQGQTGPFYQDPRQLVKGNGIENDPSTRTNSVTEPDDTDMGVQSQPTFRSSSPPIPTVQKRLAQRRSAQTSDSASIPQPQSGSDATVTKEIERTRGEEDRYVQREPAAGVTDPSGAPQRVAHTPPPPPFADQALNGQLSEMTAGRDDMDDVDEVDEMFPTIVNGKCVSCKRNHLHPLEEQQLLQHIGTVKTMLARRREVFAALIAEEA
eukprot:m.71205 g.71205  ORF g.71205 m.71205 type:complete len:1114 (-) comp12286_c1_seq2:287-3628(-)